VITLVARLRFVDVHRHRYSRAAGSCDRVRLRKSVWRAPHEQVYRYNNVRVIGSFSKSLMCDYDIAFGVLVTLGKFDVGHIAEQASNGPWLQGTVRFSAIDSGASLPLWYPYGMLRPACHRILVTTPVARLCCRLFRWAITRCRSAGTTSYHGHASIFD
jgi:hypothetical protein